MNKYENVLDINGNNSAAFILKNVKPYTRVLEFGPANGYMTQYMQESLNCKVNIVEYDYNNGQKASKFAEHALIDYPKGDIEQYYWLSWATHQFDHIIFADVLEHLVNPWKVLKSAVSLLKQDGTILISIPNIGHNSVLIDLWNGKFTYRELGLLDNTHLRFFTRESLNQMVIDSGLYVNHEFNTFCSIKHTEFKNSIDNVPDEISSFLLGRPDANLYQFVWELKKI